jgi:hypothetical protein
MDHAPGKVHGGSTGTLEPLSTAIGADILPAHFCLGFPSFVRRAQLIAGEPRTEVSG